MRCLNEDEQLREYEDEFNRFVNGVPSKLRLDVLNMVDNVIRREMFGTGDGVSNTVCPFCGSGSHTRYGHNSAGKQRYHCRECGGFFVDRPSGSIIFFTKLPLETWSRFAECFVDRLSCRRTAEKIDVTVKTAWFMRVRTLEALKRNLPSFQVKADCDAYVDGIYFNESFKGVSFKHLGTIPREPRRSGSCGKRGISDEKVCVMTAVGDDGSFFYDISCRGAMTKDICEDVLCDRICEGSIINTDKHRAYPEVMSKLKVSAHNAYDSGDHGKLEPIDHIHSLIRAFLQPFHGVSTKWLDLYMAYFKWLHGYVHSTEKLETISSKQIYNGDYDHRWRHINKMRLPFRGLDLSPQKI